MMLKRLFNLLFSRKSPELPELPQQASISTKSPPSAEPIQQNVSAEKPQPKSVPTKCLAYASFKPENSDEICGEIWLLSTDQELVSAFGTDIPLPNVSVFSALGFDAPLGIITANGFGDCFFLAKPENVDRLLSAIKSANVAALYAMHTDYAPFYCPRCRVCYDSSQWETGPIYDESFYDYMEATCPKDHRLKIMD